MKKAWAIVVLFIICSALSFPLISAGDNPVILSDGSSLTDNASRGYVGSRSGSEALQCVDTIASLRNVPQSLSEAIIQVDTLIRLRNTPLALSTALTVIDSLIPTLTWWPTPGGGAAVITTTTTSSSVATTTPTPQKGVFDFVPLWGWVVIAIVVGGSLLVLALTPTVLRVYRKKG